MKKIFFIKIGWVLIIILNTIFVNELLNNSCYHKLNIKILFKFFVDIFFPSWVWWIFSSVLLKIIRIFLIFYENRYIISGKAPNKKSLHLWMLTSFLIIYEDGMHIFWCILFDYCACVYDHTPLDNQPFDCTTFV